MKKKITALLSVILAFVLCFALVACNDGKKPTTPVDPGTPGGPNTPDDDEVAQATQKAVNAIKALFDEKGVRATVNIDCTTKSGSDNMFVKYELKKVGDRVLVSNKMKSKVDAEYKDGDTAIIDLTTGYSYRVEESNGKTVATSYSASLPAGLYDYIVTMHGKLTGEESLDTTEISKHLAYDSATSTLSYSYDGTEKINDFTEPLITAYKTKGTLTGLIDDYVELFTDGAYIFFPTDGHNSVVKTVTEFVPKMQNVTLTEILDILKTSYKIDVDAILAENGIDVAAMLKENFGIDTTWAAIKARKLGEVIVGAYNGVMQALMPQNLDQVGVVMLEDGEGDGMQAVIMQALASALNGAITYVPQEGDPSAAKIVNDLFTMLKGLTDSVKINAVIDEMLKEQAPELVEFISKGVKIQKAKADFSVKLDENDKLDTLMFKAEFAHNYQNNNMPEGYTVLADNDYNIAVTFKVNEVLSNPQALTIVEFNVDYDNMASLPTALVYGKVTEDVKVFVEFGGKQNDQNVDIQIELNDDNAKAGDIVYDKASSCVIIKASYFNAYFEANGYGTMQIYVTYSYTGDDNPSSTNLDVTYLPDDPEELELYIVELIQGLMGGGEMPATML